MSKMITKKCYYRVMQERGKKKQLSKTPYFMKGVSSDKVVHKTLKNVTFP